MQTKKDLPKKAIVTVPKREGHNGPFFEAECKDVGKITVSLKGDVWKEDAQPEGGTTVVLWDIRRKRKGWRAYRARFFRPSDEEFFNNTEELMRTSEKEKKDVGCE